MQAADQGERGERGVDPRAAGLNLCVGDRALVQGTGVASYGRTLVAALEEAGATVRRFDDGGTAARRARPANWLAAARLGPRAGRWRGDRLTLRDAFREAQVHFNLYGTLLPVACDGPPGVVHWTYPMPIRLSGWRNFYTVHDAIPLTRPDLTPIRAVRHRRLLDRIAERAERIVTVSAAARDEIVAALGCPADLVAWHWQAVDGERPSPVALPPPLRDGGYLLFCGTLEPRKNLLRLIEAHRASGTALPLVLAGAAGWQSRDIVAAADAAPGVVRLPYQDRSALLGLIAAARAVVFPSLAEGFGLPVAEAMALGTPVLTADRGALAEVAERACLTIDPHDVPAMAAAIARLARDDTLVRHLSAAGRARAAAFARGPYARWLLSLYAGSDHAA